jgi:hypothetical protein
MASISRNLGRVNISSELIRESLAMPEHATIKRIYTHPTMLDVFVFVIDCDDFQETESGEIIPEYTPIVTADYDKKPSKWLTLDFGDPV